MNKSVETIIKELFGDVYIISVSDAPRTSNWPECTVVQIIHENCWKDIWLNGTELQKTVKAREDVLSDAEMVIWQDLCDKGIVKKMK